MNSRQARFLGQHLIRGADVTERSGPDKSRRLGLSCGVEFMHVGVGGDGDAEPVALDGDLAPGDGIASGQDPKLVGLLGVQGDHRPPAHAQQMVHRHMAAAEHHGKFNRDIIDLSFVRHQSTPSDESRVHAERMKSW